MKYFAIVILGLFGFSQSGLAGEFTLDYTKHGMKFDTFDASLSGYSLGYRGIYDSFIPYIEYQATTDKKTNLDYSAINLGIKIIKFTQNSFTAGFIIEGGYARLSHDEFKNDYDFFSLGGGGFANYSINRSLSLFISSQYFYYLETTSNTRCRDGSSSESSGSGTCSHHGGVAYYNDKIGDANGLKITIGLSFAF